MIWFRKRRTGTLPRIDVQAWRGLSTTERQVNTKRRGEGGGQNAYQASVFFYLMTRAGRGRREEHGVQDRTPKLLNASSRSGNAQANRRHDNQ